MNTGEEEFTPPSFTAGNVNFTVITEPGAGKMKILTGSFARWGEAPSEPRLHASLLNAMSPLKIVVRIDNESARPLAAKSAAQGRQLVWD